VGAGSGVVNTTITNISVVCSFDGTYSVTLIPGRDGNFYGNTGAGGSLEMQYGGFGTVFKMTPAGVESVLHSFGSSTDGHGPGVLIEGSDGNFYGTTMNGGVSKFTEG